MRLNQVQPPFDKPEIRRAILGEVTQADHMEPVRRPD